MYQRCRASPSIRAARPAWEPAGGGLARARRASVGRAPAWQRVRQRARYGLARQIGGHPGQRYRVLDARGQGPPPLQRLRP